MKKQVIRIAVDGPSGAGKSTIAKKVAQKLKIDYIDTGAMYRAVAYKILSDGISLEDSEALNQLLAETDVDLSGGEVLLNGTPLGDKIRTPEVTKMASACSAIPMVRAKLVALQQAMGRKKSVIMDGRDIGTNVLTDAEYKFFLTASAHERALRRCKELLEKGQDVTLEQVERDIVQRDKNDSERELNPLRKAEDAKEIDSTSMTIEQVVAAILKDVDEDEERETDGDGK